MVINRFQIYNFFKTINRKCNSSTPMELIHISSELTLTQSNITEPYLSLGGIA